MTRRRGVSQRRWTEAEEARLVELRRVGRSWESVARELGRSVRSVTMHAYWAGLTALDGPLAETYYLRGRDGTEPEPEPTEYVLIVDNAGWCTAIARGDRAEIERIHDSMSRTVAGLRIEAA